jgi:hypothetical protein
MSLNCWEFKNCGRGPGGLRVAELGVCPASTEKKTDGLNGGQRGGRICWAVTGTLCGGRTQGTFAQKLGSCMTCEFYMTVRREQNQSGSSFLVTPAGRA